jgi:hypothetical protein
VIKKLKCNKAKKSGGGGGIEQQAEAVTECEVAGSGESAKTGNNNNNNNNTQGQNHTLQDERQFRKLVKQKKGRQHQQRHQAHHAAAWLAGMQACILEKAGTDTLRKLKKVLQLAAAATPEVAVPSSSLPSSSSSRLRARTKPAMSASSVPSALDLNQVEHAGASHGVGADSMDSSNGHDLVSTALSNL